MTADARSTLPHGQDWPKPILGVALVGVLLCALGAIVWPEHFFRAYLVAYLYWLGLALGCLALLMLQHVTGGKWGLALRNILEAATKTLPLCAVLFVPMLFGMPYLYPWDDPAQLAAPTTQRQKEIVELIEHKAPYLNVPFFVVRAIIYFAIWNALSFSLARLSARNDIQPSSQLRQRMRSISGPGLALYGLTVSLAAIDWLMSMEPLWYSTIFGVVLAVSQLLPGMAFAVSVLIWLAPRSEVGPAMDRETWGDLGNLLLAFAMLWAYMGFSQFFLIWCGNLPEETIWYSHRAEGFWEGMAWSLIGLYFCLPFALLLSRDIKRQPRRLVWVTRIVLIMAYVHYFWLVMPAPERLFPAPDGLFTDYHDGAGRPFAPALLWLDAATFVTVGGLWLGWFLWCVQARPLLPVRELERLAAEKEAQHA